MNFKNLFIISVFAWSGPAAHAWFDGDVCKDALASKGMKARMTAVEVALGDRDESAVKAVRARILGDNSAPTRSDRAVGDAQWMATPGSVLDAYLRAFEMLQGKGAVLSLFYETNDTGGWLFSRDGKNPNVKLQVPENFRQRAADDYIVLQDTFSGDQIYVFPTLFTDEHGNAVPVYLAPHENSVHSDLKKVVIDESLEKQLAKEQRKDLLNTVLDFRFWGTVENLRPGSLRTWGKNTPGATYQVVAAGNGMQSVPMNLFLNLFRAIVKNEGRGGDYPLNSLNWHEQVPLLDSHGRPLRLTMAVRNQDLETDANNDITSAENVQNPENFARAAENAALTTEQLIKAMVWEALLIERVEYFNAIWNEVQETGKKGRVQQAKGLLEKAIAAAQPDFENFKANLTMIEQQAQGAEEWLNWAISQIEARIQDPAAAGQKAALLARKGVLEGLKPRVTAARMSLVQWKAMGDNLIAASQALMADYFPAIESSDSRSDVKKLREIPSYVNFKAMIESSLNLIHEFEAKQP